MRRYEPRGTRQSGVVVERDAPDGELPGAGDVPEQEQVDPGANDTVRPDVLLTLDESAEDGEGEGTAIAGTPPEPPVQERLPTGLLVALAAMVVLAGTAMTVVALRREP